MTDLIEDQDRGRVRDTDREEVPGPPPLRRDGVLRVDGLRVAFEGFDGPPAVEDVSFSVLRGEVLALVGESGSGKSVTAQAVLGLLPASARTAGSGQLASPPSEPPPPQPPHPPP